METERPEENEEREIFLTKQLSENIGVCKNRKKP